MSVAIRVRVMSALVPLLIGWQAACVDGVTSASHSSDVVVTVEMGGNGTDADGFTVSIDSKALPATSAAPVTFTSVEPGLRVVRLTGLADHCFADADTILKTVVAGEGAAAVFHVWCVGGIAYHEVISATDYQIRYLGENGRIVSLTSAPGRNFIRDWSPDGSRILFSNDASGAEHLFTVRPDGSDLRQLTSASGRDIRPRWSPDGTRIAFWRFQDSTVVGGTSWIMVMNADGSNQHVLIDVNGSEYDPAWSPDGTKLYFSCGRFPGRSTLCVANADGTSLRGIQFPEMTALDSCHNCFLPTPQHWEMSPDGRSIAFETNTSPNQGGQAIWVGDLSGASAKVVTPGTSSFGGAWSPKGDVLLVSVSDGATNSALATAKPDGSSFTRLTIYPDNDQSGEFSPDATLIAFGGFHSGDQRMYTMNADGTARHQFAPATSVKFVPRWNPNARPKGPFSAHDLLRTVPASAPAMVPRAARNPSEPAARPGECSVVRTSASSRVVCTP